MIDEWNDIYKSPSEFKNDTHKLMPSMEARDSIKINC